MAGPCACPRNRVEHAPREPLMSDTPIHLCGWSGPRFLHISGLCSTCKGSLPQPLDSERSYSQPCLHPSCVTYRGRFDV